MAKVTYIGPSREVSVPKAGKVFTQGKSSECPDKVALGLNPEIWDLPAGIRKAQEQAAQEAAGAAAAETAPDVTSEAPKASQEPPQEHGGGE